MRLFKTPCGTGKSYRYDIEIDGVTKSLREWSRESGIAYATLLKRAKYDWLDKDMLRPALRKGDFTKDLGEVARNRARKTASLCWRCKNATGGCRWSQRLEPVDGWTAVQAELHDYTTFNVLECPEFVWDGRSGTISED